MKTAVEWLVEQLQYKFSIPFDFDTEDLDDFNITIQQAKEMEKEQIADSYYEGSQDLNYKIGSAEQYYNETFKSE